MMQLKKDTRDRCLSGFVRSDIAKLWTTPRAKAIIQLRQIQWHDREHGCPCWWGC